MKRISLAYFGTPDFSADFLKMILEDPSLPIEIKLVVTQPDRSMGRKKIITATPVKQLAQQYNIPVWDSQLTNQLTDELINQNIDLALLFAYGKIIKNDLLQVPKYGFWDIHPSLLPKYRGTSPMTYPLILGDKITGVTLMKMDEQMDHGSIIAQKKMAIDPDGRNPDLQQKSVQTAFELFKNILVIPNLVRDPIQILNQVQDDTTEQDHSKATYTRPQTKEDGFIPVNVLKKALHNEPLTREELPIIIKEYYLKNSDLFRYSKFDIRNSSKIVYDYFRGLYPWPGIWTLLDTKKRLKLTDVQLKDRKLIINKVQEEGKNEVLYTEFTKNNSL